MNKILLYPIRLLYPPTCTFCQDIIPLISESLICYYCQEAYPPIQDPVCKKCGKELAHDDDLCLDCEKASHKYTQGLALYPYQGTIKETLYRFKYGGHRKYAQFFAENMYRQLKETTFFHKIDLIIPVPLSKERLKQRGYNQAAEIAKYLSSLSQLPLDDQTLIRHKDTKPNSGLSPQQRLKNVNNVFTTSKLLAPKYKVILLIDDIYTTGSTVNECSKQLTKAGAKEVYSCVVCIGNIGV